MKARCVAFSEFVQPDSCQFKTKNLGKYIFIGFILEVEAAHVKDDKAQSGLLMKQMSILLDEIGRQIWGLRFTLMIRGNHHCYGVLV